MPLSESTVFQHGYVYKKKEKGREQNLWFLVIKTTILSGVTICFFAFFVYFFYKGAKWTPKWPFYSTFYSTLKVTVRYFFLNHFIRISALLHNWEQVSEWYKMNILCQNCFFFKCTCNGLCQNDPFKGTFWPLLPWQRDNFFSSNTFFSRISVYYHCAKFHTYAH